VRAGQWLAEHLGVPVMLLSEVLFRTLGGGDGASDDPAAQDAAAAQAPSSARQGDGSGSSSNDGNSKSAAVGGGHGMGVAEGSSSCNTGNGMVASGHTATAAPAPSLADDGDDLLDELLAGEGGASSRSRPPSSSGVGSRPAARQPSASNTHGGSGGSSSKATPLLAARSTAVSAVKPYAALVRPAVNGSSGFGDDLLDDLLDGSDDDLKLPPGQSHVQAAHPAAPLPPSSSVAGDAHVGKQMQQQVPPGVKAPLTSAAQDDQSSDGDDLLDELFGSGLSLGPGGKLSAPAPAGKAAVLRPAASALQRPPTAASSPGVSAQPAAACKHQPEQAASSRHNAAAAKQQLPPQPAAPARAEDNDLLSELMADDEQHRELQGSRGASNGRQSRRPEAGADKGIQIAEVFCCQCSG
jgi:hypothetical protein